MRRSVPPQLKPTGAVKVKKLGLIALGTERGVVIVWDLRTGELLNTLGEVSAALLAISSNNPIDYSFFI